MEINREWITCQDLRVRTASQRVSEIEYRISRQAERVEDRETREVKRSGNRKTVVIQDNPFAGNSACNRNLADGVWKEACETYCLSKGSRHQSNPGSAEGAAPRYLEIINLCLNVIAEEWQCQD